MATSFSSTPATVCEPHHRERWYTVNGYYCFNPDLGKHTITIYSQFTGTKRQFHQSKTIFCLWQKCTDTIKTLYTDAQVSSFDIVDRDGQQYNLGTKRLTFGRFANLFKKKFSYKKYMFKVFITFSGKEKNLENKQESEDDDFTRLTPLEIAIQKTF